MALPDLLEATAIPVATDHESVIEAEGERVLDALRIPHQEQDQWCWCAVAAGICAFRDETFTLRQCEVASSVLGVDVCADPTSDSVNKMMPLDEVLAHFQRLGFKTESPMTFEDVAEQIDAGLPVCIRIRFMDTGNPHVTVIRGYRRDGRMLMIDDPSFDESTMPYEDVVDRYEGSGSWKQSYRVL
ncbi:papain-like cysteine protease family protein [Aquabacterium sp.]|jgi:hypothetical protein|uniref:papain-like cysteine protease family protein n=1 Tax=Aquabacterium sp. TaxID=1872578 RepID=UPI0025BA72E5|nr:papain-like cysteine protease family protein [Aquabacterium sp.]